MVKLGINVQLELEKSQIHCSFFFFFFLQISNNIKSSSELQWNHVSLCMLNSGAIRAPIDEHYKNGNSSSTIAERSTLEVPASGYHGTVCVLICRLHNHGGHPHSPPLWRHC